MWGVDRAAPLHTPQHSLTPDTWDLRYGAPLISPTRAAREYLPCILISSLTGTLPWQETWASQILSALSWAQPAMLSR